MLENYQIDKNGLIQQLNPNPRTYDQDYSNIYNGYSTNDIMSYLRLGYIIGSIGRQPESILDIGYGNGSFLKLASEKIKCYGHDISNYPLPENVEFVDDIYNNKFDVICFFDVLEHFIDPYFIKDLNCNYIVISVPECHYFSDEWFKDWKHRRPDEHLWHFNKESLIKFFNYNGYNLINISNVEDIIRKNNKEYSNILSAVFKKERS